MSAMRKGSMVYKQLCCSRCGTVMTIPRRTGKNKPSGHIKTMWCYRCKEKTDFIEGG